MNDLFDLEEELSQEDLVMLTDESELETAYSDGWSDCREAACGLLRAAVKRCRTGGTYRHADLLKLLTSVQGL